MNLGMIHNDMTLAARGMKVIVIIIYGKYYHYPVSCVITRWGCWTC